MEITFTDEEIIEYLIKHGYKVVKGFECANDSYFNNGIVEITVAYIDDYRYPRPNHNFDYKTILNEFGIYTVFNQLMKDKLLKL